MTREAIAVGVKPWSARATSTASNIVVLLGGPALGDQPVGRLAERDLTDQLTGEVVSEEEDVIGVGRTEAGAERRRRVHAGAGDGHLRISSLCSPRIGAAAVLDLEVADRIGLRTRSTELPSSPTVTRLEAEPFGELDALTDRVDRTARFPPC